MVANEILASGSVSREAIGKQVAAARTASPLRIAAQAFVARKRVHVRVRLAPVDRKHAFAETLGVVPVLYRKRAETVCTQGENRGRTLVETHIALEIGKPLSFAAAVSDGVETSFALPKRAEAQDLGVVILIEDDATLRTLDCVALDIEDRPPPK